MSPVKSATAINSLLPSLGDPSEAAITELLQPRAPCWGVGRWCAKWALDRAHRAHNAVLCVAEEKLFSRKKKRRSTNISMSSVVKLCLHYNA